jgi:hypothetical protein
VDFDIKKITKTGYDIRIYVKCGLSNSDFSNLETRYHDFEGIETFECLEKDIISNFGQLQHKIIDPEIEYLETSCSHPNKYINKATLNNFWVCPDCKADLGDA